MNESKVEVIRGRKDICSGDYSAIMEEDVFKRELFDLIDAATKPSNSRTELRNRARALIASVWRGRIKFMLGSVAATLERIESPSTDLKKTIAELWASTEDHTYLEECRVTKAKEQLPGYEYKRPRLDLMKVEEISRFTQLSRAQAYRLVANGEIPSVRFGKHIRVHCKDFEAWIEAHTIMPDEGKSDS